MRLPFPMTAVGCLIVLGFVGCGYEWGTPGARQHGSPGFGRVAVIDLNAVARQLGRDEQMAEAIQQWQASFKQQLGVVKASYEQQIAEKQQEFGEMPTQDQLQALAQMRLQARSGFHHVQQQAQQNLNTHRAELVQRFREEVKPIARQVASEKGLSLILTRNDTLFDYDTAIDITAEVAKRMTVRQQNDRVDPTPPTAH